MGPLWSAWRRLWPAVALGLLLLAGCRGSGDAPLPALLAAVPTIPPTPTPISLDLDRALFVAVEASDAAPSAQATAVIAMRPAQAQLFRPLDENFGFDPVQEAAEAWRPPPYPVPLSLHPDDHYWLIRPIPSGYRNFDLEWYPYGNDVLVPALFPYRIHHGLDFPNDTGTPILAAAAGTVIHAGPLPSARNGVNYYGNTVVIAHDWQWRGQDVYTLYAHTLELFVAEGDRVNQGDLIAGVGASGEVSGAHLHLEVRIGENNYANTRNPALWIAPYDGWGTLAGRFTDRRGRPITGAPVSARALGGGTTYAVLTYAGSTVLSDDFWDENFVIADLPAGEYVVLLTANGLTYERTVDVLPGQTNFVSVQTQFDFNPTPTPTATPPPLPTTAVISDTVPAETPAPDEP